MSSLANWSEYPMRSFESTSPLVAIVLCLSTLPEIARSQPTEKIDTKNEAIILSNVSQLTFPHMGFVKAGEAYFSPDGETVIFQAVPDGQEHYQIYTIPSKGGTPKMVSTGRGACTCAYFRPDGKKIIFASSHEDPRIDKPDFEAPVPGYKREGSSYSWDFNPYMDIYEADLNGGNLNNLTKTIGYDAEGAYSKDGKHIVFASNRDGHMNLYAMGFDGSSPRQITKTTDCYNGGPFLSPDGRRVIFRADRQRKDYLQIYMVNLDGSNEVRLTSNDAVNWAPYWHPNSKTVAFTTSLHGHRNYEVYLLNVDTRDFRRVTHSPRFDGLPVFSVDGRRLMWTSQRGNDGSSQVFIAEFTLPDGF